MSLKYLHTMVRVKDLEKTMAFFNLLGLREIRRNDSEAGRFSLIFMAAEGEDRKSTRLNSSHITRSRMPSSA